MAQNSEEHTNKQHEQSQEVESARGVLRWFVQNLVTNFARFAPFGLVLFMLLILLFVWVALNFPIWVGEYMYL